jgi:hypothetical protein
MVEINEGVALPQPVAKFFAANDLAGMLQQHSQDLARLVLQLDLDALFSQLGRAQVQLKNAKPNKRMRRTSFVNRHGCLVEVFEEYNAEALEGQRLPGKGLVIALRKPLIPLG